ncbi:MAG: hypothetical protein R3C32_06695 [Chloroflexota bacterium]
MPRRSPTGRPRAGAGAPSLSPEVIDPTLGVLLKYEEDVRMVRVSASAAVPRGCPAGDAAWTGAGMTLPGGRVSGPAFLSSVQVRARAQARGFRRPTSPRSSTSCVPSDLVDIGERAASGAGAALFIRRKDELEPYERARPLRRGRARRPEGRSSASDRPEIDPRAQPSRDS